MAFRPGGGGDDGQRGGAGPAQVLVWQIEDLLIVGVAVDGRHEPVDETPIVEHDLHHRNEAVRGTGRVRDDVMLGSIVFLVIHSHDDGDVFTLRWG